MTPSRTNLDGLVKLTHLVYALHAFAVMTGVLGSAFVLGAFVASLPSVVAVVLNYARRDAVRGTWLESHFRWQIRTFWFAVLWVMIAVLTGLTLIGLPLALLFAAVAGLWVFYRVARGWWTLLQRQPLPMPAERITP